MIRIKNNLVRRPPAPIAGVEPSPEEQAKHQRKVQDEAWENFRELSEALSMDSRDEVTVVSGGPGAEVHVVHDLGVIPERWKLVDKDGSGDIWRSRDHQWSDGAVYFVTSAEEGVEFTVVLGRKPKRRDS